MTFYKHKFATGKSKYGNHRTTHNGFQYDSKKEAGYAMELDMQLKGRAIRSWERQVKLSLDVNGEHIANYFCDFLIHHIDGSREYVEIKSPITMTDVWKMKWKLSQALYKDPDISWTVIT